MGDDYESLLKMVYTWDTATVWVHTWYIRGIYHVHYISGFLMNVKVRMQVATDK